MPKPYPEEFRREVVAVARKHEAPLSQIARDFGISEATPPLWDLAGSRPYVKQTALAVHAPGWCE